MKLDKGHQELLFEARPDVFSPMNVGRLRWSWVEIAALEADEVADLVTEAWRQVVPKKASRTSVSLPPHGGSGPKGRWGSPSAPVTPSPASRELPHEGEQKPTPGSPGAPPG